MKKIPGSASSKIKAHKKLIDLHVFVLERKIPIQNCGGVGDLQRPLRASTAQGERVTLAHSETVPAGSYFICTIRCDIDDLADMIEECLKYGKFHGLGQWRNSGKGTFVWELLESHTYTISDEEFWSFRGA